jgi:hypothetical protein
MFWSAAMCPAAELLRLFAKRTVLAPPAGQGVFIQLALSVLAGEVAECDRRMWPHSIDAVTGVRLPYAAVELRLGDAWKPAATYGRAPSQVVEFPLISQRETVGRLLPVEVNGGDVGVEVFRWVRGGPVRWARGRGATIA